MLRRTKTAIVLILSGATLVMPPLLMLAWALSMSIVVVAPHALAVVMGAGITGVGLLVAGATLLRRTAATPNS